MFNLAFQLLDFAIKAMSAYSETDEGRDEWNDVRRAAGYPVEGEEASPPQETSSSNTQAVRTNIDEYVGQSLNRSIYD